MLKPDQTLWRYKLKAAGQAVEVMGERDLAPGGAVDMMLPRSRVSRRPELAHGRRRS